MCVCVCVCVCVGGCEIIREVVGQKCYRLQPTGIVKLSLQSPLCYVELWHFPLWKCCTYDVIKALIVQQRLAIQIDIAYSLGLSKYSQ